MYPEELLTDIFTYIVNMSITGSYVIIAVLFARLLLKKSPKKISYLLWIAPFFRLISPFTLSSKISLFNLDIFNREVYTNQFQQYIPLSYSQDFTPEFSTGLSPEQSLLPSTFEAFTGSPEYSANPLQIILFVLGCIWLTGIFTLLIYAGVTFIKTKSKLRTAVKLEKNIYQSERISAPFVMGIFRPKIYLPYNLNENEKEYIILHENTHIKNLDHIAKILAFFILTVHWFNPLCYLAFMLMSRDMEMACDEAVLKNNEGIKKDYSSTLLSFAAGKKLPSPSPLCFGESGVSQRIKNALSWKKPKIWVVTVSLIFLGTIFVSLITNPRSNIIFNSDIEKALDSAVSEMILEQAEEGKKPYFCATEGHVIFGLSENDDEVTVYGYMSCSTMNFINGYLSSYNGSGSSRPFVATFWDKDGFFKLKEVKYPESGMGYGDSVRALFPAPYKRKALNGELFADELREQMNAQAREALEQCGLDCKIVAPPDTNIVLMSNYEAQEKMNSHLGISSELYPDFVGVAMYKNEEGYTVYERRADAHKGRYYLAEYLNGSKEASAFAFDTQGNYLGREIIPVKDFFLYESPEKDTELYYGFDSAKQTTTAIIL